MPPTVRCAARTVIGAAFAALMLVVASVSAVAQRSALRSTRDFTLMWWNITNGLPQSSIHAIVQVESGELWIATHGGLLAFDGHEFRRYDLDSLPGLSSNRIMALIEDGAGGMWFATREGRIHHLSAGRIDATIETPGKLGVLALLLTSDGSLWIRSDDGALHRYAAHVWKEVSPSRGVSFHQGLCLRRDGIVCAGSGEELLLFDAEGSELARMSAPSFVTTVAPDARSGVWVGLVDGIAIARDGEIARYAITPPLDGASTVMLDDGRGSLWVGAASGVKRVATDAAGLPPPRVRASSDMPHVNDVRCILLDREDNVWLGGPESGLMRLRPSRVMNFEWRPGQSAVTAMCPDGSGGAWVGFLNRGLARLDGASGSDVDVPIRAPGASPPVVRSLLRDRRGRTWLGANSSWLRCEEGGEFEPLVIRPASMSSVGPMTEVPRGVWISDDAGRIQLVDNDDRVVEEHDLGGPLHVLATAPDGSLWAGGEACVFHVDRGQVERFGMEDGLPAGTVRDILPHTNGDVWFATYGGGLAHSRDGEIRRLAREEGLPDSSISSLVLDDDDRLWMLSNFGLMMAPRTELVDVLAGRRARIDPVSMSGEAGLNEGSAARRAGFQDEDGYLWFGTISGAVRVDAIDFPFHREAPPAVVRRVLADGEGLASGTRIEVPARTRRLLFEFTAFTLTAPDRTRFRYRLDGYDEDWVESGALRQASYTALSPGPYDFRVMARNEDGVWSTEPTSIRVDVLPAWWQTPWFHLAAGVAIVGLLYGFHRTRVGIVQRRGQVLLEATQGRVEAEQRSSRLRDELAHVARVATAGELATSLAHEVNQPLAAIVTNAEAGRRYIALDGANRAEVDEILRDIAQQGERASEIIRRLRQFLRKHEAERTWVDVNALIDETLPLVRRELEDHRAVLHLDLDGGLPVIPADRVQIQQVLVNLVKNACDALSNHAGTRAVHVSTRGIEGSIRFEVHDSGPGVAPEMHARLFEPYATTKATGMGLGLAICRTIVEAHGGRLAAIESIAGGAAFRVVLPKAPDAKAGQA